MSWDIYGNPLKRGHCEVHPHIAEEYPCSLCVAEQERRQHPQPVFLGTFAGEELYGDELVKQLIDHLKQALIEIENPVAAMQKEAEESGCKLDGMMAVSMARDAEYLKGMAKKALDLAEVNR